MHGPLIATLLQAFALRCRPGALLKAFNFRGTAPPFVDRGFHLEAVSGDAADTLVMWARGPEGELVMKANAVFGS